jgi:hypothetical protein
LGKIVILLTYSSKKTAFPSLKRTSGHSTHKLIFVREKRWNLIETGIELLTNQAYPGEVGLQMVNV